ncbi:hypothetical protein [Janthinobacterium fluminis]|uniref:Glycine zipper domain-containing protein n=1 Tax=Janthinobacterium fluminis TaxID=2987524 RepID=A0ABT5K5C6_9BURK|nr:hypothetical protein [Janthinobacterium fluminis]MDC8760094.1 hypothetical protein [Janthinobacterium fluminis]
MASIVAGHFELQEQVEAARAALTRAGFAEGRISAFYVNQPGQHDVYELGGDRARSPGAKETPEGVGRGVLAGGVVGAALGAASAVVTGPVGPVLGALLGAHVGSLYSLHSMKEAGAPERGDENRLAPRRPGMLLAVQADDARQRARALALLRDLGAANIEQAEGAIVDGDWGDFDPLSVPVPAR